MDSYHRSRAEDLRSRLMRAAVVAPAEFRAALMSVPFVDRDAWVDVVLGLGAPEVDGSDLPSGGVPYLPCPVDALVRMVDEAAIGAGDVVVDVGAGPGRAGAVVHLLSGAAVVGIEVQRQLVLAARGLTARLPTLCYFPVLGDAVQLSGLITLGSVFFLYCPFGADRVEQFLDGLEPLARTRELRVCTVDLPLPRRPWLEPVSQSARDLAIFRTTLHSVK